jgi:hypothetical protein
MYGVERQTSGNDETKPFFWSKLYYDPKKRRGEAPHKIDFCTTNRPKPSFGQSKDTKKHNFVWIKT